MIEVIVAVFVLILVLVGSFSLIQQTVIGASLNNLQLTASYLGHEGVELVRNTRDTNWLEGKNWQEGMPLGEEDVVFLDENPSRFKRTINVIDQTDYLQVKVLVEWSDRGKDYSLEVINHLHEWYGE